MNRWVRLGVSLRARLTLWYCTVVVIVLVTGAAVGLLAQSQRALQRLDDDLARSMATLEGVMRTEFGKGMSLEEAAAEASSDVVVPAALERNNPMAALPPETAAPKVTDPSAATPATRNASTGENTPPTPAGAAPPSR